MISAAPIWVTFLLLFISLVSLILVGMFIEKIAEDNIYALGMLSSLIIFAITFLMGMIQFSKNCKKSVVTKVKPAIEYRILQIEGWEKADTTYVYKF